MHTPQVYLVFCATIPNPARLYFVLEMMVTRSTPSWPRVKLRVQEIYGQYCPQKLDKLPQLFEVYKGREYELLNKVEASYLPCPESKPIESPCTRYKVTCSVP